ncbi:vanadium-dependent haloperoxidase [Anthocerotibacter panamensis]|uniref:vanadium-dependent haloperoxidase n=1 Tax=Anthocerotibacter panamensis TaxID=2857077 RepID=UPI001C403683|nr:vanadium-dependent haloperoxidase [Anthocerotibacter panamensis]
MNNTSIPESIVQEEISVETANVEVAPKRGNSRRTFLAGTITAATAAVGAISAVNAQLIGPTTVKQRLKDAQSLRTNTARIESSAPLVPHPTNNDEALYFNKIGSYSKGLPHNALGEVDLNAYNSLSKALSTGAPVDYENIILGTNPSQVRLTDPQNALAFTLEGQDSHNYTMPAPPAFSTIEEAGEMAEVYWMALLKDVPFSEYTTNPLAAQAAADLRRFPNFIGVTPATLFRSPVAGNEVGPYVSQFLLLDLDYGSQQAVPQAINYPTIGLDFMTDYDEWLAIQRGFFPAAEQTYEPELRWLFAGRGLGQWVHIDWPYQSTLNACLLLLSYFPEEFSNGPGASAVIDAGNPYNRTTSRTQRGFNTFGPPHPLNLISKAADLALKAAWFQKWQVHRRLRPEVFAGRVHNQLSGKANYPIHPSMLSSTALPLIFEYNRQQNLQRFGRNEGTWLCPQGFVEGSPTHPAYPSGHATFAAAGATVLKAYFNESFVIPNPVKPTPDGLGIEPYIVGVDGPALTVGGELNKLAANIALGRPFGGVHWRTDAINGNQLGEDVAITILQDLRGIYNETFRGFSLTRFNGQTITI